MSQDANQGDGCRKFGDAWLNLKSNISKKGTMKETAAYDWSDILFCPNVKGLTRKGISKQLASQLFHIKEPGKIESLYEQMGRIFSSSQTLSKEKQERNTDKNLFIPAGFEGCLEGKFWKDLFQFPCVGHDLPVWLQKESGKATKKIMLVSQSPLRKDKKQGHLTISSPFGFHHIFHKGNNPTMKYIVFELLNRRSLIYLTDCRKLYVNESQGDNRSSKGKRFWDEWEAHLIKINREMLKKEIEIFNPDVILTFGAIATDAVCKGFFHSSYAMNVVPPYSVMQPCKPVLALIHPSHHATRMIKNVYGRKKLVCANQDSCHVKDYYGKAIANLFH